MTRLAFSADWHVDEYGSRVDPETGLSARLMDYLKTAEFVSTEARRRGAEALVIAGDLSERRHPSPWLVARIQEAIAPGPARIVVTRGNHDNLKGGRWIGDVLARRDGWDAVDRPRVIRIGDVAICALGHLDRHWLRAQPGMEKVPDAEVYQALGDQFLTIARGLYAEARTDYPDAACVLVCHQTLAGAHMSETQQAFLGDLGLVVDARALAAIGFEGIVAGHLHRHQLVLEDPCPVLYPGSIERVDFGEQNEPKGFVIADVKPGRFSWEFVETPARRFVTVDYASDATGFPDVEGAVVRAINVEPSVAADDIHKAMELAGAWDVVSITRLRPDAPEIAGGLSESLGPLEALSAYFAADPDAEPLVALGRELLEAAA
jgi:DNA repair protein SbcD/Mre11